MAGAGPSYQERQRGRIQYTECGEEMTLELLEGHMQKQHGNKTKGRRFLEATDLGGEPRTYRMAFPTDGGTQNCPIEGCPGQAATRTAMRVHCFN